MCIHFDSWFSWQRSACCNCVLNKSAHLKWIKPGVLLILEMRMFIMEPGSGFSNCKCMHVVQQVWCTSDQSSTKSSFYFDYNVSWIYWLVIWEYYEGENVLILFRTRLLECDLSNAPTASNRKLWASAFLTSWQWLGLISYLLFI